MSTVAHICLRSFFINQRISQQHVIKVRDYCRWVSRKPSKVIFPSSSVNEDKIIDLTEDYESKQIIDDEHAADGGAFPVRNRKIHEDGAILDSLKKSKEMKHLFDYDKMDALTQGVKIEKIKKRQSPAKYNFESRKKDKINEDSEPLVSVDVFDLKGNYIYEKLPYKDAVVGNRIIKLKNKKNRNAMNQFLVEGWRLIGDGLQAGCQLDTLIFSQLEDLEYLRPYMPTKGVKIYKMPYKEMQMWSGLETCPGLMGIFKKPSTNVVRQEMVYPINVICDNIRDPGNLGSILRTCLGVGCSSVLLTKGCVDIWDSKVLRSGAGAHFRMPIHTNVSWDDISQLVNTHTTVLIADNNSNEDLIVRGPMSTDDSESDCLSEEEIQRISPTEIPLVHYYKLDYGHMDSITLVVGGETQGISQQCFMFSRIRAGVRINIPLTAGVDSLNSSMALGVIGFEIKKQLIEAGVTPSSSNVAKTIKTSG